MQKRRVEIHGGKKVSERLTFEEYREKANRRFGRKLSDREIAEVAIGQLNDSVEVEMLQSEEIDELRERITELRVIQPPEPSAERTVSDRICEILSTECDRCDIEIMKVEDGIYMDYKVYGNPLILFPKEEE